MQIPSFNYNYYGYDYGNNHQNINKPNSDSDTFDDVFGNNGCETCENRAYQDKSSDSSVSMQTPTKMNPSQAAHMVRSHENEHIRNDRIDAENNGREVVWQSVRLHYDICRECGISYVSGGQATTVSKGSENAEPFDFAELFNFGKDNPTGELLDVKA